VNMKNRIGREKRHLEVGEEQYWERKKRSSIRRGRRGTFRGAGSALDSSR